MSIKGAAPSRSPYVDKLTRLGHTELVPRKFHVLRWIWDTGYLGLHASPCPISRVLCFIEYQYSWFVCPLVAMSDTTTPIRFTIWCCLNLGIYPAYYPLVYDAKWDLNRLGKLEISTSSNIAKTSTAIRRKVPIFQLKSVQRRHILLWRDLHCLFFFRKEKDFATYWVSSQRMCKRVRKSTCVSVLLILTILFEFHYCL